MIYHINKIALAIINPITVGAVVFVVGLWILHKNKARKALWLIVASALWFSFWATAACQRMMCCFLGLDRYPEMRVDRLPDADIIIDLGGGMGVNKPYSVYPYLSAAADRPWHVSRIWKAQKAPKILVTSNGIRDTDYVLLRDLGIPADSILVENASRNTEQNAVFSERTLLSDSYYAAIAKSRKIRAILVTSVSHMPRAIMIFKKCAPRIECTPAATDYKSVCSWRPMTWDDFIPHVNTLSANLVVYKECLGVAGYWLRGF